MDTNLVISAFFALGIALIFLGLDLIISGRQHQLKNRLGTFARLPQAQAQGGATQPGRVAPLQASEWKRKLATDLARADLPITPSEYILSTILLAMFGLLIGLGVLRNPLVGLGGLVFGLVAPRLYLHYLHSKRLNAFSSELDSALTLLANSLRSGHGLTAAFESVSKEFAPPLSVEFGRVVREVALGLPLREALFNLTRRNPVLDLEMVVTAINVNHEIGGNLSEVLDQIASTIRDRVRMASEIRAITAQQVMSANVLMILPVVVTVVIYIINPDYVSLLWTNNCGIAMLVVAVILLGIGYLVIQRLLKFRY